MKNYATDTIIKIKPDYQPETTFALNWFQLSNGDWTATDRGPDSDKYDVSIRIYGTEAIINNFINEVESNRHALSGANVLNLYDFNSQEHIFGADIDYSGVIDVTVFMEPRAQKTWKGFEQKLSLSIINPTFIGGNGFLPPLRFLDTQYEADAERTINKYDSYNRSFSYEEHNADIGLFSGIFTFEDHEMIGLRRYLAKQRTNTISIPNIIGVNNPFGRRTTSYPLSVKIIEFQDLGMYNLKDGLSRWKAKLSMAEVV